MQAREILRKCSLGFSSEQAMMASRPEKVPPQLKSKKEIIITNDLTQQLKNDIKFLKKVSDLKTRNMSNRICLCVLIVIQYIYEI